jgi:hypothetical protein
MTKIHHWARDASSIAVLSKKLGEAGTLSDMLLLQ